MGKYKILPALFLLAGACGGTSGPPPAKADAGEVPNVADAMPMNVCTDIEAQYADLGELTGTATLTPIDEKAPDGPQTLSIAMPLGEEAEPDVLFLELWGDTPPFEDAGFIPLTQELNGNHADLVLCGACVFIAANYTEGALIDFNMASGGELVIDTIDVTPGTGSLTGSLSDLRFREVTVSEAGQEVVEDGCRSQVEGVRFNFTMAETPPQP